MLGSQSRVVQSIVLPNQAGHYRAPNGIDLDFIYCYAALCQNHVVHIICKYVA